MRILNMQSKKLFMQVKGAMSQLKKKQTYQGNSKNLRSGQVWSFGVWSFKQSNGMVNFATLKSPEAHKT